MWKLLALGGCALVLVACGASNKPSATSQGANGALVLARCMRSHGVPNFPDLPPGQGLKPDAGAGVNPRSPSFQGALQACKRYLPNFPAPGTMTASQREKAVAFARCMRTHGQPDFPDPTAGAPPSGASRVLALRGMFFAVGPNFDPRTFAFRHAATACGVRVPTG